MWFDSRFHAFYHRVRRDSCADHPAGRKVAPGELPPEVMVQMVESMGFTISVAHYGYCNYGLDRRQGGSACTCNPTPHYRLTPPVQVRQYLADQGRYH